ncbi:hypothetical protein M947_01775 [Sulfurimonas hongkongensis]|uniref:Uncharacterized protein n=1 Tax=Sulfurimonas hongkongensis TaxID=1172190 RepID=T0JQW0_9BACT|nr:hypothetical protein [Sulfurimonas hongkongensis]EQB40556.1 hypothetical protein M947_01775 [Sulfurimonas hongkongensis]
MINEAVLNYVILFVLLESYEIYWQKAPSIMGMLIRMHKYYRKSIFLFLLMQPTFYFSIGFVMLSNYSIASMIILFIKTADIATKILLLEQVFRKKQLSHELSLILLAPINGFLPYLGLVTYPALIILSLDGLSV